MKYIDSYSQFINVSLLQLFIAFLRNMNVTIHSMIIVMLVSVIFQQTGANNFEEIEHDQPAYCDVKSNHSIIIFSHCHFLVRNKFCISLQIIFVATNVLKWLANVVMKRYLRWTMNLTIVAFPKMTPVKNTKALATVKLDKKSLSKIFVKTKANALFHARDM